MRKKEEGKGGEIDDDDLSMTDDIDGERKWKSF